MQELQQMIINAETEQGNDNTHTLGAQCVPLASKAAFEQAKQIQKRAQCKAARSHAYQMESDGLAFKYLAMQAQYGDSHEQTVSAKKLWLDARTAIQARYCDDSH
ncbi:hypothetical protein HG263_03070 [Pseudoalteromonas sp. JBTF-M23]|uniref:Uncharacterized protein n=1 Tax=Pseudoalteromonas caenipelagi TaxID=2726988 RepID=A0A849V9S9_9GAMM|nr:hypothetical protein [Pseudoalteromonas caenipelagi]NOU49530.1 hypothetical protein [Pseudoalteromonas caenipelagi]